jgi:hypothetical protein
MPSLKGSPAKPSIGHGTNNLSKVHVAGSGQHIDAKNPSTGRWSACYSIVKAVKNPYSMSIGQLHHHYCPI